MTAREQTSFLGFEAAWTRRSQASGPASQSCPRCGYCLAGLPASHRCPECGLGYDDHTWVHAPRKSRFALRFLLCWALSLLWIWRVHTGGAGLPRTQFTAVVLAVYWAVSLRSFIRARRRHPSLAVTPEGLLIGEAGAAPRLVEWSRVTGIKTSWAAERMFVHILVTGERPIDVSACLSNLTAAWEFVDVVNSMRQRRESGIEEDSRADDHES